MIRKSGHRFSEKIMVKQKLTAIARCVHVSVRKGRDHGQKTPPARPRRGMARQPPEGCARPRSQSASEHQLPRALHRAGIHLDLPGHRTAGFCASRDRLCAGPLAAGIEIAETIRRKLPQSRRVPRGLHGDDRQTHCRRDQAEIFAHRRLLVSARRHSDRRVLADRTIAEGHVASRPGCRALSRTGVTFALQPLLECLAASSCYWTDGKGRAKLSSWPSGSIRWKKRSPHSASRGTVAGWYP